MRHQEGGALGEKLAQVGLVVEQHVARAGAHENLHAGRARPVHAQNLRQVAVGGAQIEGIVGMARAGGLLHLVFPSGDGCGLRHGVRHIHHAGDAAGHCRTRFALHRGFVGQPRLAHVNVTVYRAGQNVGARCVKDVSIGGWQVVAVGYLQAILLTSTHL